MSLLTACQSAAIRLVGRKPATIFASTDIFEQELADLATEGARDIAKSHDWQRLTKLHTIHGDGTTTDFDLPSDYDRMLLDSSIYDETNWAWGYQRVVRVDDWLSLKIKDFGIVNPGLWTLFGNQLQFIPAPEDGSVAQFPYISNQIISAPSGALQTQFQVDDDTFTISDQSERLLTLWLVWRWREMKRLEYGADEANFQKAFSDISGKDQGARPIKSFSRSRRLNARFAYPWTLGA